jgi:hypothetical protein
MSEADAQYNMARMMQHIGQGEMARRHLMLALQAQPTHEASQQMLTEGKQPPPDDQPVERAQYQPTAPENYNNMQAVYQPNPALAVPVRPADFSTPPVKPAVAAPEPRPIPVLPVTIDQFESRPSAPTFSPPPAAKVAVKPQAAAASARRTTPEITYTIEPEPSSP